MRYPLRALSKPSGDRRQGPHYPRITWLLKEKYHVGAMKQYGLNMSSSDSTLSSIAVQAPEIFGPKDFPSIERAVERKFANMILSNIRTNELKAVVARDK